MQMAIESTGQIVDVDGVPCRVWRGTTAAGVPCVVFVHRIAVQNSVDQSQFDAELMEQLPPNRRLELERIMGGIDA